MAYNEIFKGNPKRQFKEFIAQLMLEKGFSHSDIFGEVIEGEFEYAGVKGSVRLVRKGLPLAALNQMVKENEKIAKRMKGKHGRS